MITEKIEAFWENATADDLAEIIKTGKPIPARIRDADNEVWREDLISGWSLPKFLPVAVWIDADGVRWKQCQVYREPSWYTNKPDPGSGFRLLGKLPDEELKPGDEYFDNPTGKWHLSGHAKTQKQQLAETWYRRRIEQLLSGHRWLVSGDRLESGDLYYEKGVLLEVGHEYWGNRVMLTEAFMRKIEQPEPEPQHCVLPVGYTATLPNGQTIKATEKGFEVTQ
jgi:hypothetical protein